ncbi:hypothetical protein ACHQM5_011598 [Ranunculus cassubicifolius]
MGVVLIDGTTVRSFVEDESAFNKSIDSRFASLNLNLNNDGVLSQSELRKDFETFRLTEPHFGVDVVTPPQELSQLYDSIFEKFDYDHNKIMLGIADGLGESPIQMVLEDDEENLLKQAADLEAAKISGNV